MADLKPAVRDHRTLPTGFGAIALVFVLLMAARILGLISVYFFEEDEVSLAVGAAALVADTSGRLYRYTAQIGYYRLIEGLDWILGSRIDLINGSLLGWLVSQPQHEAVVVPCRSLKMHRHRRLELPAGSAAMILPMSPY